MMINKILRSRYGRFPFFEPLSICFCVFTLSLAIGMLFYKECIFMFLLNLFWVWRIYSPYFEKFYFDGNRIVCKKFIKSETLDIPENAVFVISYMAVEHSICSRNKYIVSIIDENTQTILGKLHENERACEFIAYRRRMKNALIYDSKYIQNIFANKVIYSFACDEDTQQIFAELKRMVIVPRSLESELSIKPDGFDLIIDEGR